MALHGPLVKASVVMYVGYRPDFHDVTSDPNDSIGSITIDPVTGFYMGRYLSVNGTVSTSGGCTLGVNLISPGYVTTANNPWMRVWHNAGATSLAHNTVTTMVYDTIQAYRGTSFYSTSTGIFTSVLAGVYAFDVTWSITTFSSTVRFHTLLVANNTTTLIEHITYGAGCLSGTVHIPVGSYVEIIYYQLSGSATTLATVARNTCQVTLLGKIISKLLYMLLDMILLCSLAMVQLMGVLHFHCSDVEFDCKFYDLFKIFNRKKRRR
jgi:hypothetical protein